MYPSVISGKFFLINLFVLSIYIAILALYSSSMNSPRLFVCAENGKLESYIIDGNVEILLYPSDIKNCLHCMGRGMPYYDNRIEYVIGSISTKVDKILQSKYHVESNRKVDTFRTDHFVINMKNKKIYIQGSLKEYVISRGGEQYGLSKNVELIMSEIGGNEIKATINTTHVIKDGSFQIFIL